MNGAEPEIEEKSPARFASVVGIVLVGVAAAGFLVGTRAAPNIFGYSSVPEHQGFSEIPGAVPQAEMEATRYEARIEQQQLALAAMGTHPGFADRPRPSEEEWTASLAARAELRAYDGAPPVVPHPVDTHGAPACLVCHENGADIEGRIAPVMSHEPYQSCLQCHAPPNGFPFEPVSPTTVSTVNTFEGFAPEAHGPRAWESAPPTLPHRSLMRENCASCHGPWATGLRTSHPGRQSCTQCHALSAELDQRAEALPPLMGL